MAQRLEMSLRYLRRVELPPRLHERAAAHLRKVLLHKRVRAGNAYELLVDLSPPLQSEGKT